MPTANGLTLADFVDLFDTAHKNNIAVRSSTFFSLIVIHFIEDQADRDQVDQIRYP